MTEKCELIFDDCMTMITIGVDSRFFLFDGATNEKGHEKGQLEIEVPSLDTGVLNEYLGKLKVQIKVIKYIFL